MAETSLKPGDVVSIHLKLGRIVSAYADFDSAEDLQIIAADPSGYYLYVPDYLLVLGTVKIDPYSAKSLGIKKQFIDSETIYIEASRIVAIRSRLDGCVCARCSEYFAMSIPNQPDGTMVCFLCRNFPFR